MPSHTERSKAIFQRPWSLSACPMLVQLAPLLKGSPQQAHFAVANKFSSSPNGFRPHREFLKQHPVTAPLATFQIVVVVETGRRGCSFNLWGWGRSRGGEVGRGTCC
ncbi:hypothetical protein CEXT_272971 [Caerostris extrusa]|uniref:Secreted protein n=1 Tax=Caerostris extrusa TaxID=172846 RepID=A0AAV4U9U9_CAEEX|nr:hypothetical protein CEXT_272971 [Caerostris extrusa]